MKKILMLSLLVASAVTMADAGTYEGTGTVTVGAGQPSTYSAKLVVKEVEAQKVYEVSEGYKMADGTTQSYVSTFRFADNGTLSVERNGVKIGCGYCFFHLGSNHWCDYREETDRGPLHVNMYYDATHQKFYRIGDFILLGGVGRWQDNLDKTK